MVVVVRGEEGLAGVEFGLRPILKNLDESGHGMQKSLCADVARVDR